MLASWWHSVLAFYLSVVTLCNEYPFLYTLIVWPAITGAASFGQYWIAPRYPHVWAFLQHWGADVYGWWVMLRKKFPRYVLAPPPKVIMTVETKETVTIRDALPAEVDPSEIEPDEEKPSGAVLIPIGRASDVRAETAARLELKPPPKTDDDPTAS